MTNVIVSQKPAVQDEREEQGSVLAEEETRCWMGDVGAVREQKRGDGVEGKAVDGLDEEGRSVEEADG